MATIRVPSTALLRAFLKPSPCITCQTRLASDWIPREKYAKVNRLGKLHRKQKQELRDANLATEVRASLIPIPTIIPDSTTHPFQIQRTTTNSIPVYHDAKNGGNRHITTIRKVSGDVEALCEQLRTVLALPDNYIDSKGRKKEMISVNKLTGHVIIRGWRGPEVKAWATSLGF